MYRCESQTKKKVKCWRIDAFKLWSWRRFLRVPQTTRRSKQSILKEISPDAKAEAPILGHLMWRADLLEKTLMLGKIEGRRRSGGQRMRWLDGITNSMDMNLSKLRQIVKGQGSLICCSPWGHKEMDTIWWLKNNNKPHPASETLKAGFSNLHSDKPSRCFWSKLELDNYC